MLSELDKAILNAVQGDFPLEHRPFAVLAERVGTDEDTLLERLDELRQRGYIRRLGAYFDSDALGYHGTLVALRVDPGMLDEVGAAVNRYAGVTHNYERIGEYNLWFTMQSESEERKREVFDEIRGMQGVEKLLELPSIKKYKVRVQFHLK